MGLYGFLAWKFLGFAAILIVSGILRMAEGTFEWIVLFPTGAFMCYVGAEAIRLLQQSARPTS